MPNGAESTTTTLLAHGISDDTFPTATEELGTITPGERVTPASPIVTPQSGDETLVPGTLTTHMDRGKDTHTWTEGRTHTHGLREGHTHMDRGKDTHTGQVRSKEAMAVDDRASSPI